MDNTAVKRWFSERTNRDVVQIVRRGRDGGWDITDNEGDMWIVTRNRLAASPWLREMNPYDIVQIKDRWDKKSYVRGV